MMSVNRVNYPQDTNHMSFPNTEQEILVQSKASYELEEKLAWAVNESEEIPQGTTTVARKELFNCLLNVDGQIAADVVQNLRMLEFLILEQKIKMLNVILLSAL